MSISQMSEVWAKAQVGSQGELLVLLALADWANDEGWCWPSVPRIAEKSRLGQRQVRRILKQLAERGMITIEENRGRNNTNRYRLNLTVCPVLVEIKPVIGDIENLTSETQNLTFKTVKPDIAMSPEPSENHQEPPKEPSGVKFELPVWVPQEAWSGFLEMRKRMRKVPTDRAKRLIMKRLDSLRSSGQDPGAVLDQSTENGWQGVFELRRNRNGSNRDNDEETKRLLGID